MKNFTKLFSLLIIAFCSANSYGQCVPIEETIVACSIETIDGDGNLVPDGIINLYEEYTNQIGGNLDQGVWSIIDNSLSLPLDESSGDVALWEYRFSSASNNSLYVFELKTDACGDNPSAIITLELGGFSGEALPASGTNDTNIEVCESNIINLFEALTSDEDTPSPHLNGIWELVSAPNNASGTQINEGILTTNIDYQMGLPIIDRGEFEVRYVVANTDNCPESITNVKLSVVRQVDAGEGTITSIIEEDILNGVHDADIDLTNDAYLFGEDIEGFWSDSPYLDGPDDNTINLRAIYNDIILTQGIRFGSVQVDFTYIVNTRSAVCNNTMATVSFLFTEQLRPFGQEVTEIPELCKTPELTSLNLFDEITFTSENGSVYEYNNDNFVNWSFISGPSNLGLVPQPENINDFEIGISYHLGTVDLSIATPGTYVFRYAVSSQVNNLLFDNDFCDPFDSPIESNYCNQDFDLEILTADITIIIEPFDYAGENTNGLEFCETESSINLIEQLIVLDGFGPIVTTGIWTNSIDNSIISNLYEFPDINEDTDFEFRYSTIHPTSGCMDEALLSFTVINETPRGNAGNPINDDGITRVCSDDLNLMLFDQIENADVGGIWTGPAGYVSNDHIGEFEFNNLMLPRLIEGDYLYTIGDGLNCSSIEVTTITIDFEDPIVLAESVSSFHCLDEGSIDLLSLLEVSAPTNGTFTDVDLTTNLSGSVFTFTEVGIFNFTYTLDIAPCNVPTQNFIIEISDAITGPSPGISPTEPIKVCSNDLIINLFDQLGGDPSQTGIWTGPFGYQSSDHLGTFNRNNENLPILGPGTFMYTVGGGICNSPINTSQVVIEIIDPVELGADVFSSFCKVEGGINLFGLLDQSTTALGQFTDIENTNALSLDGFFDFSMLEGGIYNFSYSFPNEEPCETSSLNVEINIIELIKPDSANTEFCILNASRLEDIEVFDATENELLSINWYESLETDEAIINNPVLIDGDIYYVANVDAQDCESDRLLVEVNILNVGETSSNSTIECPLEFQDGVSADGNGVNDTFSINWGDNEYDVENAFPDFQLEIFNRYGTSVYKGGNTTSEFNGNSNVSLSIGTDLPSGVYYYIFNPNFKNNKPIQGSFYLSK